MILLWYKDPSRAPRKLSFNQKPNEILRLDDDTVIIAFDYDVHMQACDLKSGTKVRSLKVPSGFSRVLIQPDMLAVGNGHAGSYVEIYDIPTGDCLQRLAGHSSKIRIIAFTSDVLLSGCEGKQLRVWSRDAQWKARCLLRSFGMLLAMWPVLR